MMEVLGSFRRRLDAAIDSDEPFREAPLEAIDAILVERRDLAIFLRAQSFQPGFPRMHPHAVSAGRESRIGERVERGLDILLVDP